MPAGVFEAMRRALWHAQKSRILAVPELAINKLADISHFQSAMPGTMIYAIQNGRARRAWTGTGR